MENSANWVQKLRYGNKKKMVCIMFAIYRKSGNRNVHLMILQIVQGLLKYLKNKINAKKMNNNKEGERESYLDNRIYKSIQKMWFIMYFITFLQCWQLQGTLWLLLDLDDLVEHSADSADLRFL